MQQATVHDNSTQPVSGVDVQALTRALAEPFQREEVRFKPAVVSGNRAMALAYVDARAIMDRLDAVLGPLNWQDEYECLPEGSVVCRLRLRLGNEWLTKVDVGSPSEQPDGGDRLKAAFSDALKRAAVKFGIGRYLYRLPSQWAEYCPQKKQFVKPPALPAWALRKQERKPAAQPAEEPAAKAAPAAEKKPAEAPLPTPTPAAKPARPGVPASGAELLERLRGYEVKLVAAGKCQAGALLAHVQGAGRSAGHSVDLATWAGPAIRLAIDAATNFAAMVK